MYVDEDPMQASRAMDPMWLLRWKWNPEKQIWKIKARLVVKGVQDDRVLETTYSPTASRMAQRIILTHAARRRKRGRRVASIDVAKAFLQGEMYETDDMVLVTPPPDLRRAKHVLKCRKSVYGLKGAPRKWYLALRTFLLSLGGCELASGEKCVIVFGDSDSIDQYGRYVDHQYAHEETDDGQEWAQKTGQDKSLTEEPLENVWLVISMQVDDLLCSGDVECLTWVHECLDKQFGVGSSGGIIFPTADARSRSPKASAFTRTNTSRPARGRSSSRADGTTKTS